MKGGGRVGIQCGVRVRVHSEGAMGRFFIMSSILYICSALSQSCVFIFSV